MNRNTRLGIASDHAGYELKEAVKVHLVAAGYDVTDYGTDSPDSTDYPDYAHPLATAVENGDHPFGVAICGSGQGICMTVNKHAGVRGALVWNEELAALSRQHNNANVVCLAARFLPEALALRIVDTFLDTEFEGGRHARRVDKIAL